MDILINILSDHRRPSYYIIYYQVKAYGKTIILQEPGLGLRERGVFQNEAAQG